MINRISSVEALYNTPFLNRCLGTTAFWNVKTTRDNLSVLVNVIDRTKKRISFERIR